MASAGAGSVFRAGLKAGAPLGGGTTASAPAAFALPRRAEVFDATLTSLPANLEYIKVHEHRQTLHPEIRQGAIPKDVLNKVAQAEKEHPDVYNHALAIANHKLQDHMDAFHSSGTKHLGGLRARAFHRIVPGTRPSVPRRQQPSTLPFRHPTPPRPPPRRDSLERPPVDTGSASWFNVGRWTPDFRGKVKAAVHRVLGPSDFGTRP